MKLKPGKQLSIRILIMYMISILLFLSFIELHIHTKEAAATADHGFSVSVTSLSSGLINIDAAGEIKVSPDNMLENDNSVPDMLAIFLLLALVIAVFSPISIPRIRDSHTTPELPFFGTPGLRAPPQ